MVITPSLDITHGSPIQFALFLICSFIHCFHMFAISGGCTYKTNRKNAYKTKSLAADEIARWRTYTATVNIDAHLAPFVRCFTDGSDNRKCCRINMPAYIAYHCEDLCDGKRPPTKVGHGTYAQKYGLCLSDGLARATLAHCNQAGIGAVQKPLEAIRNAFGLT